MGVPGLHHGPHQVVLGAQEVEGVAVPQMLFRPGLAVGALVLPDHEDGHLGLSRHVRGDPDALDLCCGIDQLHVVLEPPVPVGWGIRYLAALGVDDGRPRADPVADPLQEAHAVGRPTTVAPEVDPVGVGSDHGDGLELFEVQGQQALFVLQQDDRLLGRFKAAPVLRAVRRALRVSRVHIGIVEQPQPELGGKDAGHGEIHFPLARSLAHLIRECP